MRLRYAGKCYQCNCALLAGTEAHYDSVAKKVYCIACAPVEKVTEAPIFTHGQAGAEARLMYEKKKQKHEEEIRAAHPVLGDLIVSFTDDTHEAKAWDKGALGEEKLGKRLNSIAHEKLIVIHDRRIPKSKANIDHMAITPVGIWVIDAKRYKGRPEKRVKGGLFSTKTEQLWVNNRQQSKILDGIQRQVDLVASSINDEVPVRGALCFIDADWPLIGGDFRIQGIECLWPKKMAKVLQAESKLDGQGLEQVNTILQTFKSYT